MNTGIHVEVKLVEEENLKGREIYINTQQAIRPAFGQRSCTASCVVLLEDLRVGSKENYLSI